MKPEISLHAFVRWDPQSGGRPELIETDVVFWVDRHGIKVSFDLFPSHVAHRVVAFVSEILPFAKSVSASSAFIVDAFPGEAEERTFELPAYLASALINGDVSGIDEEQDLELVKKAEWLAAPGHYVDVSQETFFTWYTDLPGWGRRGVDAAYFTVLYPKGIPARYVVELEPREHEKLLVWLDNMFEQGFHGR